MHNEIGSFLQKMKDRDMYKLDEEKAQLEALYQRAPESIQKLADRLNIPPEILLQVAYRVEQTHSDQNWKKVLTTLDDFFFALTHIQNREQE